MEMMSLSISPSMTTKKMPSKRHRIKYTNIYLHRLVDEMRGVPTSCSNCGAIKGTPLKNGKRKVMIDWAHKNHEKPTLLEEFNPNDFIALSRKCHWEYDSIVYQNML